MFSILLNNNNEGISFNTFYEKFIEICNSHKNEDRALAFAFILYDFGDAHLHKILHDEQYWLSLNSISGKYLTVFSLHYDSKAYYDRVQDDRKTTISFMTTVSDWKNPSENSNVVIEKYWGKDFKIKYPAVMFFQIEGDQVLDYTLIELSEEKIEESFLELKNYISKAVDILKKITPENKRNYKEIFKLIKTEVDGINTLKKIKKTVKTLTSAKELATSIFSFGK